MNLIQNPTYTPVSLTKTGFNMSGLYKAVKEEDRDEWTLHQGQDLLKCTLLTKLLNCSFMRAEYVGVMNSTFQILHGCSFI